MSKTAEEILEKYCPSMSNIYLDDNGIKFRARVVKSMEEYASQQLAEKDKEIERFSIRFAEWISSQNYKNHTSNGWSVVNRGAGSCDVKPTYSTEQLIELYKQSLNK